MTKVGFAALVIVLAACSEPVRYDVVIRDLAVYDGSGSPRSDP